MADGEVVEEAGFRYRYLYGEGDEGVPSEEDVDEWAEEDAEVLYEMIRALP